MELIREDTVRWYRVRIAVDPDDAPGHCDCHTAAARTRIRGRALLT